MTVSLSIIVVEHNESRSFVQKMFEQVSLLPYTKELIFVTSLPFKEFYTKYGPFKSRFPVSVIGNIQSAGSARTIGAQAASGDRLIFMDCHVCFTSDKVAKLLATLERHKDGVVGPAVQIIDFPSCKPDGGIAYGVMFNFLKYPYEWVWLPPESTESEYRTPFISACQFACKKSTINHLLSYGGFLTPQIGVGMEEEIFMRLQRLGHPVYLDPTVTFGHLFKGYPGKPSWDEHSTKGFYFPRVASIYVNVFDDHIWHQIESICLRSWGDEWTKNLELVKKQYSWLRNLMKPLARKIDERWFFRVK